MNERRDLSERTAYAKKSLKLIARLRYHPISETITHKINYLESQPCRNQITGLGQRNLSTLWRNRSRPILKIYSRRLAVLACFRNANLRFCNLSGANLPGTNFINANLEAANLRAANLSGAYFRDANLEGTNLEGAFFKGKRWDRKDREKLKRLLLQIDIWRSACS